MRATDQIDNIEWQDIWDRDARIKELEEQLETPKPVVHLLRAGSTLCGLLWGSEAPPGDTWISEHEAPESLDVSPEIQFCKTCWKRRPRR